MASTSKGSSNTRACIDLTDDETDRRDQRLAAEFAKCLEENATLKARVRELECRTSDLESEARKKDLEAKLMKESIGELYHEKLLMKRGEVLTPAGPSRTADKPVTRRQVRSPSVEVVDKSVSVRTKAEPPATPTISRKTQAYVSLSRKQARAVVKAEKPSPKKKPLSRPSPDVTSSESDTGNAAKRRKINATKATTSTRTNVGPVASKPERRVRPDVKSKNVFFLPPNVTNIYLGSAPTLEINPPPNDEEVSRACLRLAYGGSDQHFLQYIKDKDKKIIRRIVFPMLEMNPAVPFFPGEPGLIFASRHEILKDPPWTLFVKRSSKPPAVWLYLGEYVCELCGTMTAEQFRAQSVKVQTEWAEFLLGMKAFDVYVSMRSRIALRKAKLIPLEDKDEEKRLIEEEMTAVKTKGRTREVEVNDIIKAFSVGDEGIDIIRMTCQSYDHDFARDMVEKWNAYQRGELEANEPKKSAKSSKGRMKAKAPGAKRKSLSAEDEGEGEGEDIPLGWDDEDFVGSAAGTSKREQRPRRSSRPVAHSGSVDIFNLADFPLDSDDEDS